jgi:hypothetical protein
MYDRQARVRRFRNFVRNGHNDRRVTRICKSLAEMGQELIQFLWLSALAVEIHFTGDLADKRKPYETYWVETLKSATAREALKRFAATLASARSSPTARDQLPAVEELAMRAGYISAAELQKVRGRVERDQSDVPLGVGRSPPPAGVTATPPARRRNPGAPTTELRDVTMYLSSQVDRALLPTAVEIARLTGATVDDASTSLREAVTRAHHELQQPSQRSPRTLVVLVPLEYAQRVNLTDLEHLASTIGVDPQRLQIHVVAADWLNAAYDDYRAALTQLRSFLVLRFPPFLG